MRVLVTGGLGFIGSHVAELLRDEGHDVRVLDVALASAHQRPPDRPDGVEIIIDDVRDPAPVTAALRGVDAVCHQAALVGLGASLADLPGYASHNDLGTAVLLAAMAEQDVGRLVLASSMVVYGEGAYTCREHGPVAPAARRDADLAAGRFEPGCPVCGQPLEPGLVGEDARLDPRNVYAATKLHQEQLAASWARVSGGQVTALRYHNVYGPRMPRDTPYSGVAALFRSALEAGRAPVVFEDGAQRRDFVHVTDVARANLAALTGEATGAFNVASGEPHTVGEMAAWLAEAFGGPAPMVSGQYRLGDVRHVVASPARAAGELGFTASVRFTDGVSRFATDPLR